MAFDWEAQGILDEEHATNPQPGDYWHEMFCPICVVLGVTDQSVILCSTPKTVDRDHWTWDLSKQITQSRSDFKRGLAYGSIPGYCGMVIPQRHLWAVEEAQKLFPEIQMPRLSPTTAFC